ncbi:unnamed protein product [Leptidea sinapis]|uniref:Uncharacterized protein n=1 Tax=Leptidea sinapis TaxID=189913 RepID=A0A5E4R4Y3_9NEOP|nr:unnamed protein product [Leptidea sinapis]
MATRKTILILVMTRRRT